MHLSRLCECVCAVFVHAFVRVFVMWYMCDHLVLYSQTCVHLLLSGFRGCACRCAPPRCTVRCVCMFVRVFACMYMYVYVCVCDGVYVRDVYFEWMCEHAV